jgi:hypothetical protein
MDEKRIEDRQLAFLVDGDNASATMIEEMLAEASKYGSVIIRRVYGNWTAGGQVNTWKTKLKEYALSPYQQFPNISNRHVTKNATAAANSAQTTINHNHLRTTASTQRSSIPSRSGIRVPPAQNISL